MLLSLLLLLTLMSSPNAGRMGMAKWDRFFAVMRRLAISFVSRVAGAAREAGASVLTLMHMPPDDEWIQKWNLCLFFVLYTMFVLVLRIYLHTILDDVPRFGASTESLSVSLITFMLFSPTVPSVLAGRSVVMV